MKNLAAMLRKEGKTTTKLYKELSFADFPGARPSLISLEVNKLTPRQRASLKAMKLSPTSKNAVDIAFRDEKAKKSGAANRPVPSGEKY